MAIFALLPAVAQAEPPQTPALTGTNPISPGTSTTPLVQGFPDGVSPQVVHPVGAGGSGLVSATNPIASITIYAGDPTCSDVSAVVGEGTSAEFENPGIEVTTPVATDMVTTFYAHQSDVNGVSDCSGGLDYRQVTGPPAAPSLVSVNPASPANNNSPHLIGTAVAESTVSIYLDSGCSGAAVASGTPGELAEGGIPVSVPDNSTTTFYAAAAWAGLTPACSGSSVTYQELSPPPGAEPPPPPVGESHPAPPKEGPAAAPGEGALAPPHLRMVPASRANDNIPLVAGTASGAANVRIFNNAGCAGVPVAKGSVAQLAAGFPVQVADNTVTRFYGVAFDGAGRPSVCSPTPAVYTEDSTPPLTLITLGPGAKTRSRKPVFRFTDTTEETGTAFFCKVDRGNWRECQTPWRLPPSRRRSHIVQIKAVDAAGNAEAAGAKRRFKIVALPRR